VKATVMVKSGATTTTTTDQMGHSKNPNTNIEGNETVQKVTFEH